MTEDTVNLDNHRGMAAQKATELRRLDAGVEADQAELRVRRDDLEAQLFAAPATDWSEAAAKAIYLLKLLSPSLKAEDPRLQKLIAQVLSDFDHLSTSSS